MPEVPQSLAVVKIGQSFSDFLEQDRILARKGLSAHRLHVHLDSKGKVRKIVLADFFVLAKMWCYLLANFIRQ